MDIISLVSPASPSPSEPRPFACASQDVGCGKAFARRSDLVRHERIHRNERPFPCDFRSCNKRFIQRSALTVHMRTHTGERPHACEVCARAFSDSSSLARHRRMHTGKRLFRCPFDLCDKSFCRKATLAKHLRSHLGAGAGPAELDRLVRQSISRNALEQQAEEAHRLATATATAPAVVVVPSSSSAAAVVVPEGERVGQGQAEYPTAHGHQQQVDRYDGIVAPFPFAPYRDFYPSEPAEPYRHLPHHPHGPPPHHLTPHPHLPPHPLGHQPLVHQPTLLDPDGLGDGSAAYRSPPPTSTVGHQNGAFTCFETDPYGWQRFHGLSYAPDAYFSNPATTTTTTTTNTTCSSHHQLGSGAGGGGGSENPTSPFGEPTAGPDSSFATTPLTAFTPPRSGFPSPGGEDDPTVRFQPGGVVAVVQTRSRPGQGSRVDRDRDGFQPSGRGQDGQQEGGGGGGGGEAVGLGITGLVMAPGSLVRPARSSKRLASAGPARRSGEGKGDEGTGEGVGIGEGQDGEEAEGLARVGGWD